MAMSGESSSCLASSKFSLRTLVTYSGANFIHKQYIAACPAVARGWPASEGGVEAGMRRALSVSLLVALTLATSPGTAAQAPAATLQMTGLTQPVDILRDHWGINH